MNIFEQIGPWVSDHAAIVVTIGTMVLEVILRVWKSAKIRSLFSYAGRILLALGKLSFAIADILSKIVPDRRPDNAAPIGTSVTP